MADGTAGPGLEAAPDLSYLPDPGMADFADAWIIAGPPEARQRLPANAMVLGGASPVLREALLIGRGAAAPCELATPFSSFPLPVVTTFLRFVYTPQLIMTSGMAALSNAGHLGPLLALCDQLEAKGILELLVERATRDNAPIEPMADWVAFVCGRSGDLRARHAAIQCLAARLLRPCRQVSRCGVGGHELATAMTRCGSILGEVLACVLPCATSCDSPPVEFKHSPIAGWFAASKDDCTFSACGLAWRLTLDGDGEDLWPSVRCLSRVDAANEYRACTAQFTIRTPDGSTSCLADYTTLGTLACEHRIARPVMSHDELTRSGFAHTISTALLSVRIEFE
jgi:hypothetical protein